MPKKRSEKHKTPNACECTKKPPLYPTDPFNTEAVKIPDSRDPKTGAAIPDDENVWRARDFVNENRK